MALNPIRIPELPAFDGCGKVVSDADGDVHDADLLGMDEKNAQLPKGSGHGSVMQVAGRGIAYSVTLAKAVTITSGGFKPCPASGERTGP
jgi:hypothetical protein